MTAFLARAAVIALLLALPFAQSYAGEVPAKPKEAEYVQLGDFTVNVPASRNRREYVVMTVTLEAAPGTADKLKDISPRVQDAVLRRLMAMSEEGALKPNQTDPLTIKDALFDTISKLKPDCVKEVLITRLLYS